MVVAHGAAAASRRIWPVLLREMHLIIMCLSCRIANVQVTLRVILAMVHKERRVSEVLFAAYPSQPPDIGHTLEAAEQIETSELRLRTWRTAFGPGNFIDSNVLPEIQKSDGLLIEISLPNNNVYFEAGYAIGRQKPIIPVCNTSISGAVSYLKKIGIFDNTGYESYDNSQQLRNILDRLTLPNPLEVDPNRWTAWRHL